MTENKIENPTYLIVRTWADGRTSIMIASSNKDAIEAEYLEVCKMWDYEIKSKMFRVDIYSC